VYKAVREFEEAEASPQDVLDAVWDVAAYPEFVKGINATEVVSNDGDHLLARFTAGLAGMDFEYLLKVERENGVVRWRRVSGDFRAVEGSMTHLGGCRFRYENAMDPGFAVPGFAVRFVLERSLPRLIREFTGRGRALAAGRARVGTASEEATHEP
jgi:ribosome-associated toxin RatA of RatAB toxin-antitoxin module